MNMKRSPAFWASIFQWTLLVMFITVKALVGDITIYSLIVAVLMTGNFVLWAFLTVLDILAGGK